MIISLDTVWHPYKSFIFLTRHPACFFPGSCREKKDTEVHQLEGDRDVENNTLLPLEEENARLRREIDAMKQVKINSIEVSLDAFHRYSNANRNSVVVVMINLYGKTCLRMSP